MSQTMQCPMAPSLARKDRIGVSKHHCYLKYFCWLPKDDCDVKFSYQEFHADEFCGNSVGVTFFYRNVSVQKMHYPKKH